MQSITVSLNTAWKLKAAGFGQDTLYQWNQPGTTSRDPHVTPTMHGVDPVYRLAAPTAQEIADRLPVELFATMPNGAIRSSPLTLKRNPKGGTWAAYYPEITGNVQADTMAEALALLEIELQIARP